MMRATWLMVLVVAGLLLANSHVRGQDWPQWRGANRDARASGFDAPATWPKELTKKWSVEVGRGAASPAVVGDKVFVFTRVGEDEVIRALNAATGDILWQDQYPASRPTGGASRHPGPRSSPTVANGKVVTLGVDGVLSCYDANSGKMLWRKEKEYGGDVPQFYTASSPIVVEGLCVAQLGGGDEGGVIAFDLTSGDERWRLDNDSPAYGSPALMAIDGVNLIIVPTDKNLVALDTSGNVKWQIPYAQGGRYNSASPIISGDTLIVAGPGTGISALKLSMQGGELKEEKLWSYRENSVQFNTPVLKDGKLYGLSNGGQLFCFSTSDPETTAWAVPITKPAAGGEGAAGERRGEARVDREGVPARFVQFVQQREEDRPRRGGPGRGGIGRGGRRGRRGGGGGFGSIVDAGPVLIALSPAAELVVFQPNAEQYTETARYKVADGGTYAYPVPAGNGIYIKDENALTLWTVE